jgi:hypothetical protein
MQKEKEIGKEIVEDEEERRKIEKKEIEKEKLEAKDLEKVINEVEIIPARKEHAEIPLIKLERAPELELKKLELSKEVPKIEKRKTTISIPIIRLQELPPMIKECKLDYKLPHIEKKKRLISVSIVRVTPPPKVSILLMEFDSEIRRPQQIILPKIKVPIYRKALFLSPKFLVETFDSTINEQLIKQLEKKEEVEIELQPVVEIETIEPTTPSSGAGEEEIPDFFESVFEVGDGIIKPGGPKIIIFKDIEGDSYIHFLENVCLRIYREMMGGEPKAVKIQELDDFNQHEIKKWLELGNKIFTIDFTIDKKITPQKLFEDQNKIHLLERLEETYTGNLGFLIFRVNKEEDFEYLKGELEKINLKAQGRLNIISLEAKKLPLELIELFSGMIKLKEILKQIEYIKGAETEGVPTIKAFDYISNVAFFKEDSYFNQIFEKIKKEEKGLFMESTNLSEEKESSLHFNIKVFLVRYWVHELRKGGKKLSTREEVMKEIQTEKEISNGVTPDVRVGSIVYEVETLFGPHPGGEPLMKINRTIDKYDRVSGIDQVNIVMDNFGCLLHLKELLRKKEQFKDKRFKVKFYTLDLQNGKLIPIEKFAKRFKELLRSEFRQ